LPASGKREKDSQGSGKQHQKEDIVRWVESGNTRGGKETTHRRQERKGHKETLVTIKTTQEGENKFESEETRQGNIA